MVNKCTCILGRQLTRNVVTNDVSITAAEDGDWSVYLRRYVIRIIGTLLENGIENATAAVVTGTTIRLFAKNDISRKTLIRKRRR
jgi:hypothetical protein